MSGLILRTFILFLAVSLWNGASAAPGFPPQTSNQSTVTVKVTPLNLQDATWEFEVVFDTHSQELKDDMLTSAVLLAADGTSVYPLAWQGDPPSGHHRKGILRFGALKSAPTQLELRINRAGEPKPRVFRWTLK